MGQLPKFNTENEDLKGRGPNGPFIKKYGTYYYCNGVPKKHEYLEKYFSYFYKLALNHLKSL